MIQRSIGCLLLFVLLISPTTSVTVVSHEPNHLPPVVLAVNPLDTGRDSLNLTWTSPAFIPPETTLHSFTLYKYLIPSVTGERVLVWAQHLGKDDRYYIDEFPDDEVGFFTYQVVYRVVDGESQDWESEPSNPVSQARCLPSVTEPNACLCFLLELVAQLK